MLPQVVVQFGHLKAGWLINYFRSKYPMQSSVVMSILAGSIGLSGLLLVFLGVTLTTLNPLLDRDSPPTRRITRLKALSWALVLQLSVNLITVGLSLAWLNGADFYWVIIGFFAGVLVSILLVSIWATVILTNR